ncbi:MAG: DUF2973 domain-containing protein [Leptolyngbya sp. SIO4C1]|nr:DUF2973 domain-containing protein [Leptolyngbya sp. SIO4C1]
MLHLLYIFAFTVLAVLAVANLIRNLISLGIEARRPAGAASTLSEPSRPAMHPELLDDSGNVLDEPLLVMRSISIKDAREQLDALYESSSSGDDSKDE